VHFLGLYNMKVDKLFFERIWILSERLFCDEKKVFQLSLPEEVSGATAL